MNRDQQFNFMAVMCILLGILVVLLSIGSRGGEVYEEDFRALQEAYDTLHEGYNELQQDYSRKTEQIEYLEYRIMSDDGISEELKQEIKENVPEEDK